MVKRRFLTLASEKVIESKCHSRLGGVFRQPGMLEGFVWNMLAGECVEKAVSCIRVS